MPPINLPPAIDIVIKASHFEFVNKNALRYTLRAGTSGAKSWTHPYKKPQLIGHIKSSDPIGRIIDAKVKTQKITTDPNEPKSYLQLTARITDTIAIEKILDGRYNTVSVGSKTNRVICSECNTIITEDGLCEHEKGTHNNKGEVIHWIIDQLEYVEESFVNEPADKWVAIESINIGTGAIPYEEFMDNRIALLSQINLEDHIVPKQVDAKLSTEKRNKLPDSAFCGPGRSFPAYDKAHVTAGLRLLNTSKFSDSTKAKIKACLYRKGKRYGIVPTQDELAIDPNILTTRLEDEWTSEELTTIEDFFKENPDADLPETENKDDNTSTDNQEENTDISKLKVAELRDLVSKLQDDIKSADVASKEAIEIRDSKIESLKTKVQELETIDLQKEDEINKFLDETAIIEKKLRDSVISNIVDLKMTDNTNEDIKDLRTKLEKRQTESLVDTLQDMRDNITPVQNESNSDEKVGDPTLNSDNNSSSDTTQNGDSTSNDKFSIFDKDRSSNTED